MLEPSLAYTAADEERFWAKVQKQPDDGCWLWKACVDSSGYGQILWLGKRRNAHRIAWQLVHGPIATGTHVLHRCDTPACVRPSHLFLGTNEQNIADRTRKGRSHRPAGANNPNAKITPEAAQQILARRQQGESIASLAEAFGVNVWTIGQITRGLHWTVR